MGDLHNCGLVIEERSDVAISHNDAGLETRNDNVDITQTSQWNINQALLPNTGTFIYDFLPIKSIRAFVSFLARRPFNSSRFF